MGVFENFPYTNFHDLNLDWVLKTIKDLQEQIANLQPVAEVLKEYEKSANITNNRLLSPKGDFTGTIRGRASNLVLAQIDGNAKQLQYLADQFSDGQTGLVIDGSFFESDGIHKNYNGGAF